MQVAQLSCDRYKQRAADVARDAREVTEPSHSDDSPSAGIAEDPFRPTGSSMNSLILPTIETSISTQANKEANYCSISICEHDSTPVISPASRDAGMAITCTCS